MISNRKATLLTTCLLASSPAAQLFAHAVDPEENYNVVNKEEYRKIADKMSKMLYKKRGANYLK